MAAVLQRYGFRSVDELERTWSRALLLVFTEADYHANYTPPNDDPRRQGTFRGSAISAGMLRLET